MLGEAEAAERRGLPPGAAGHVLAKLQADLQAGDVTELLPRVREVRPRCARLQLRRVAGCSSGVLQAAALCVSERL